MLFQLEYLSNIQVNYLKKNHITACSCEEWQQMAFDLGRAERENVSHDCKEISDESTPPPM